MGAQVYTACVSKAECGRATFQSWFSLSSPTGSPLKRVEYEQMVELGMFENERVELLRGFMVRTRPRRVATPGRGEPTELLVLALVRRDAARSRLAVSGGGDDSERSAMWRGAFGRIREQHGIELFW